MTVDGSIGIGETLKAGEVEAVRVSTRVVLTKTAKVENLSAAAVSATSATIEGEEGKDGYSRYPLCRVSYRSCHRHSLSAPSAKIDGDERYFCYH